MATMLRLCSKTLKCWTSDAITSIPGMACSGTELAAMLTSSVLALSVEAEGSASMGAGRPRVCRLPSLHDSECPTSEVCPGGKEDILFSWHVTVWDEKEPVNWTDSDPQISKALRELDQFVLDEFLVVDYRRNNCTSGSKTAVATRRRVAEAKGRARKAAKKADVAAVAEGIVRGVKAQTDAARFPESFVSRGLLGLARSSWIPSSFTHSTRSRFLGTVHVRVEGRRWPDRVRGHLRTGRRRSACPGAHAGATEVRLPR